MALRRLTLLSTLALSLVADACDENNHEDQARARLSSVLGDTLGGSTHPQVSFITGDGHRDTHLQVSFDTTAFANLSDSAFGLRARDVARFALRHYEKAQALDSVTVGAVEMLRPGVERIHNWRTFSTAELRKGEVK